TYPVEGYRPLQDPPSVDLVKAHKLLGYLKNVIHIGIDVLWCCSRVGPGILERQ
ncbi:unnamed protein product, partial [Lepidochelys kempii]